MCWYCYWGWPKAMAEICDRAVASLGGDESALEFGSGHIVWSDCNFDRRSIGWCIAEGRAGRYWQDHHTAKERDVVLRSLEELLLVQDDVRVPYRGDGVPPESYPPRDGVVLVAGR